jgi:UDP-N-acetylmuramate dehydrogenase
MPKILKNTSLKPYNTFGLEVNAAYFVEVASIQDFKDVLQSDIAKANEILVLGGGSNLLLTKDFEGLVIKNNYKGISTEKDENGDLLVTAESGENWHEFVLFCVKNNFGGLENLSLIPGTVGAAPMQNIGAYGVEIKDVFVSLEALNRETFEIEIFDKKQCQFGYRESVFKHEAQGKYIILSVTFRLNKEPKLNLGYGAINDTLAEMGVENPSIADVSKAVIAIRQSKLPDPKEIGNSGSFFKNPEIPKEQFEKLKVKYDSIPSYPISPETVKVPAGWLIEQAGWKGKRFGEIGVHAKQALVLVNYGAGKGKDIAKLSEEIKVSVFEKFGIKLTVEVNII